MVSQKLIHKGKSIDPESEELLSACKVKTGAKIMLLGRAHDPETEKVRDDPTTFLFLHQ